ASHVKNVPGRKTDVNDATWLAELLAHGLIRASFVPGPEIQELRGLLRTRKQLVREKASHVQRLQKTLSAVWRQGDPTTISFRNEPSMFMARISSAAGRPRLAGITGAIFTATSATTPSTQSSWRRGGASERPPSRRHRQRHGGPDRGGDACAS